MQLFHKSITSIASYRVGRPGTDDSFSHDAGLNELIRDHSEQCGEGRRVVQVDSWPKHPSLAPSRTRRVVCLMPSRVFYAILLYCRIGYIM